MATGPIRLSCLTILLENLELAPPLQFASPTPTASKALHTRKSRLVKISEKSGCPDADAGFPFIM